MRRIIGETVEGLYDRNSRGWFEGYSFEKCLFDNSALSITEDPDLRSTVSDCEFINCTVQSCAVDSAIIEDVLVDGLKTKRGPLQTWGALFARVTLRGKIGRIMFTSLVQPGMDKPDVQYAFDVQKDEYYSNVDWALDISQGEFEECDLRGIPAHLIKRDPETQMIISRDKLLNGDWKSVDLSDTYWKIGIEVMLERGDLSTVLVAGKRAKNFTALRDGLHRLRDAGFAE